MPLLSSSLSLLPSHPAFVPFSSFRFPERFAPRLPAPLCLLFLLTFSKITKSVFLSSFFKFRILPSPPSRGRTDVLNFCPRPATFRVSALMQQRQTGRFSTISRRDHRAAPQIRLGRVIRSGYIALNAAAESGSRSTIIDASGYTPTRGAPCHGAGTDQFG